MAKFIAPRSAAFTLRVSKPRNPLVAPALMRRAGGHAQGSERQRARRDTQKLVAEFGDRSP